MRRYSFVTIDVFTQQRFGGNQLAVFPEAAGLSDGEMQALAAELNLSETVFVLPPEDDRNSARVRIFTRSAEIPFAGHPNVGTGFVLASDGRDRDGLLRFEEIAGVVQVRVERDPDTGQVVGTAVEAPQALDVAGELAAEDIAACVGLSPRDLLTSSHAPVRASVGLEFVLAEVTPGRLSTASPHLSNFRETAAAAGASLRIHLYAREDNQVRARMFDPLGGTWEDAATGSANAALGAYLLSLSNDRKGSYRVCQGTEIGRPSELEVSAWRTSEGIRVTIGGSCVPVLRGHAEL